MTEATKPRRGGRTPSPYGTLAPRKVYLSPAAWAVVDRLAAATARRNASEAVEAALRASPRFAAMLADE